MSPKTKANMNKLIEQRDRLFSEMQAIKNRIEGLEMAISLMEGSIDAPVNKSSGRRSNVKKTLIDMLKESGTTGLNASTAVEIAARRGVNLDRGTVSSLLSRLKHDEVVVYDGANYRLKEFSKEEKKNFFE